MTERTTTHPTLLITGGSSGIGLATARLFARRGWQVYEMSRSGTGGDGIVHISADVTRPEDCRRAVGEVLANVPAIDVVICNAGMGISGAAEFASADDMHRQMEVNFFGAVNVVQAVLPSMRERRGGRILMVSSLAATFSIPFQSFYSASKAALNDFALALRNEVRPWGIGVGCLLPGDVQTGFTAARQKSAIGQEIYPAMTRSVATMERDETIGQNPKRLARRLYRMATCRYLPIYNYEGWGYRLLAMLAKMLPATLVNWAVGKMY